MNYYQVREQMLTKVYKYDKIKKEIKDGKANKNKDNPTK
jgi:hypothetical protein